MNIVDTITTALGTAAIFAICLWFGKNTIAQYIKNNFQLDTLTKNNDVDTYKVFIKDELDKQKLSFEPASQSFPESKTHDHSFVLQEKIKAINLIWKKICVFNEFSNIIISASIAPINNTWNKSDFNQSMVDGTGRSLEDIIQTIQETKTKLLEAQLLIPNKSYDLISNFIKIYMLCALKTQFCISGINSHNNIFVINDISILDTLNECTGKKYSFGIDGEIITGMNDLLDLISKELKENISLKSDDNIKSLKLIEEYQEEKMSEYIKSLES
ncbi:MAG: hypothetical protein V7765_20730 [Oleispira sp.]